jgi:glutamine amidotransferase
MCRWLAYSGTPILLEELLYRPTHSLIDQSLHSRLGAETTNGDGFGVGWYGTADTPAVFHSIEPAWNDEPARARRPHQLAARVRALSARREAARSSRRTATVPPRRWLWMHNGLIRDFTKVVATSCSR